MKSNNRNGVIRDLWLGGKTVRNNKEVLTIDKDSLLDQTLARLIGTSSQASRLAHESIHSQLPALTL